MFVLLYKSDLVFPFLIVLSIFSSAAFQQISKESLPACILFMSKNYNLI